jgi:hypothetical protein
MVWYSRYLVMGMVCGLPLRKAGCQSESGYESVMAML